MKILNWFLNLFRNSKKIAQDAINIVNVLKSIVESPLAYSIDKLITGNDNLVVNADKWLKEAVVAAGFISHYNATTAKTAIKAAVLNLLPMTKEHRGLIYNSIAGQMVASKTGIDLEESKDIVEQEYQKVK